LGGGDPFLVTPGLAISGQPWTWAPSCWSFAQSLPLPAASSLIARLASRKPSTLAGSWPLALPKDRTLRASVPSPLWLRQNFPQNATPHSCHTLFRPRYPPRPGFFLPPYGDHDGSSTPCAGSSQFLHLAFWRRSVPFLATISFIDRAISGTKAGFRLFRPAF